MIDKLDFDECIMFCDSCGKPLENYNDQDFYGTIEEAKGQGWSIKKDKTSGQWEHLCPNCKD